MPADISAYIAAAKQVWTSDRLEEQLYQETPTLSEIEKTDRFALGKEAVTPLHVSRNGGYTALSDNESVLNPAGNQGQAQAKWNYTNHFVPVKILHSAFVGTKGASKAVVNVVDNETELAVADLRHELERQLFSVGNGTISNFAVNTTVNTLNLDATAGPIAISNEWLFVGKRVDIGSVAAPTSVATGRTITAVGVNSITIDGAAVTTAATDFVSTAGSRTGAVSREMTALRVLADATSTVGTLAPASVPQWKGYTDTTTTTVTLASLLNLRTQVMRATGTKPDLLIVGPEQAAKLYLLLQPQVRFNGDQGLSAGNVEGLSVFGMKIIEDPRCPAGHAYALSRKRLFMVREDKPYWFGEVVGQQQIGPISGEAAWGGTVGYHVNLATDARNSHAAMVSLT